jgi:thiol-disulfide isomerase/thioredoxin
MKKALIHFFLIAAAGLLLSCSSTDNKNNSNQVGVYSGSMAGQKTSGPTFAVPDLNGAIVTFESFKGKGPLVLNFWGTWCPPCRRELPDLKRIYAEYKPKGLEIVGLAVKDTPDKVRKFSVENQLNWVMLMATIDAQLSFNVVQGIPTTIFIDRTGKEVSRFIGAREYEDFKAEIEKII